MKSAETRKLTPRQERFVGEYLADLNATAAATRAGYKDANIGRQLIAKNNVYKAIQTAMAERRERTKITADAVLGALDEIRADAMRLRPDGGGMVNHAAALKALELQGKHLGMWVDRQQVEVNAQVTVVARRIINPLRRDSPSLLTSSAD